jgi:hypothetical protein
VAAEAGKPESRATSQRSVAAEVRNKAAKPAPPSEAWPPKPAKPQSRKAAKPQSRKAAKPQSRATPAKRGRRKKKSR